MVTTRSKRWNGKVESLSATFLKEVMAKMVEYGDRVRFSLTSAGPQPSYEVINKLDKKMAFDRNHHLLQPQADEFAGANASAVLTVDQINDLIAGRSRPASGVRTAGTGRAASTGAGRTSAAKQAEQFAAARYEYFKNNRQMLPARIADYSNEIAELMGKGIPVEDAFNEVLKKHF